MRTQQLLALVALLLHSTNLLMAAEGGKPKLLCKRGTDKFSCKSVEACSSSYNEIRPADDCFGLTPVCCKPYDLCQSSVGFSCMATSACPPGSTVHSASDCTTAEAPVCCKPLASCGSTTGFACAASCDGGTSHPASDCFDPTPTCCKPAMR